MIRRGALDKTLNQIYNGWSWLDTIIQTMIKKVFNDPGIFAIVISFVMQGVVNEVGKELKWEPVLTEKTSETPDRNLSVSAGITLDEESRVWSSRREKIDWINQRHLGSMAEWRDKCKKQKLSSFFSS